MKRSVTRFGIAVLSIAAFFGSAVAQSLGTASSTAQIQSLQRTAMKVGVTSAAIGVGIAVIGFVAHHHHGGGRKLKNVAIGYAEADGGAAVRPSRSQPNAVVPAAATHTTPAATVAPALPAGAVSPSSAANPPASQAQQTEAAFSQPVASGHVF